MSGVEIPLEVQAGGPAQVDENSQQPLADAEPPVGGVQTEEAVPQGTQAEARGNTAGGAN